MDKSIVTAAHQFIIDNHLMIEIDGGLTRDNHASHVTATVERTDIRGIFHIVGEIIPVFLGKYDARHQRHGTCIHILGELSCISKVYLAEFGG